MKLVNFFSRMFSNPVAIGNRFNAEVELNEEEEYDIYEDEHEYPLFV